MRAWSSARRNPASSKGSARDPASVPSALKSAIVWADRAGSVAADRHGGCLRRVQGKHPSMVDVAAGTCQSVPPMKQSTADASHESNTSRAGHGGGPCRNRLP